MVSTLGCLDVVAKLLVIRNWCEFCCKTIIEKLIAFSLCSNEKGDFLGENRGASNVDAISDANQAGCSNGSFSWERIEDVVETHSSKHIKVS